MNKRAASKLSALTSRSITYEIRCFYLPVKVGQVVEFEHVSSGIRLHVQAMVASIDIDLSAGCPMTVILNHVRYV